MVYSSIEVVLNLPHKLFKSLAADVTRCFEIILLQDKDNLSDVVNHILKIGFHHSHSKHPQSVLICVDEDENLPKYAGVQTSSHMALYFHCIALSQTIPMLKISNSVIAIVAQIENMFQTITLNRFNQPRLCNIVTRFLFQESFSQQNLICNHDYYSKVVVCPMT